MELFTLTVAQQKVSVVMGEMEGNEPIKVVGGGKVVGGDKVVDRDKVARW